MSEPRSDVAAAVAIIGMACRWPGGASDPGRFWRLLADGVDAVGEIPADRMDVAAWFDPRPAQPGRMASRWGGYLGGLQDFDAAFFEMSPREAERLDPQHRLLLETSWEALEDGGIDPLSLDGSRTGVFIGQWASDFEARLFGQPGQLDFLALQGSGRYASSGRLSHFLGLRGPSLTLDTASSSSLAAVHLACRSLRAGDCTLAIAGGVNVILQPHVTIAYSQSRMMSLSGRCRFGDAAGDGYVRSEGAGLVLLKLLADALRDGDPIHAVIRGSALASDGRTPGGLGAPGRDGRASLLHEAYRDAGIDPARTGYVEAHGTGTRAGDPVELGVLAEVVGAGRRPDEPVLVGSVKTNIGHAESAAGVAGLMKASLCLAREAVPPSLHLDTPNPQADWAGWALRIPTRLTPWPRVAGSPRVAAVSAFGIAGANVHMVLEEAPPPPPVPGASEGPWLLPLSARSPQALVALASRYAAHLADPGEVGGLDSLCWTAATRRAALAERVAFVAADAGDLRAQLRAFASGEPAGVVGRAEPPRSGRVAFVFPGQGAQWMGMGRELLAHEPVFREVITQCDAAARAWLDVSLQAQLEADPGDAAWRMDRIDVIQPVLTALALAYARLWAHRGVTADAVVGHSLGEVAAACWAGVLSIEEAMHIACRRSALMQRTSGQGAMAVVELPAGEVERRLAGRWQRVSVAVVNGPGSCVVSGDPDAVDALLAELDREQVFSRRVKVDVASHSPQMEPLAAELAAGLAGLQPHASSCPVYSTVDGAVRAGPSFDAAYWGHNLRRPVQFGAAVSRLLDDGVDTFIEIGPHPLLLGAIGQVAAAQGREVLALATGRRDEPERAMLLRSLAGLWTAGRPLDWRCLWPAGAAVARLPLYPWQRERHWCDAAEVRVRPDGTAASGSVRREPSAEAAAAPVAGPLARPGHDVPVDAETNVGLATALGADPADGPAWWVLARPAPGQGEVEVAIEALVLDPLRPGVVRGREACGRVTRCGPGVAHLAEGDVVVALGACQAARFACFDARRVVRCPPVLAGSAAEVLPVVPLLAAWHGLHHLARLGERETVLLPESASAVAQAIVQLARMAGATVLTGSGDAPDGEGPVDLLVDTGAAPMPPLRGRLGPDGRLLVVAAAGEAPADAGVSRLVADTQRLVLERPQRAAEWLGEILTRLADGRLAALSVARIDASVRADAWPGEGAVLCPGSWPTRALAAPTASASPTAGEAGPVLRERLAASPPGPPRRGVLLQAIRQEVAVVLRLPLARVPQDRPLRALGMDSLMALELRQRLERHTGLALSPSLAWNHPTVQALADHLGQRLSLDADEPGPAPAGDEVEALAAALAGLDDEALRRLLDAAEGEQGT